MTLRRRLKATTASPAPASPSPLSPLDTLTAMVAIAKVHSTPHLSSSPCSSSNPPFNVVEKTPTTILHLPFEIVVGQIFAILKLTDLAQLARVSRGVHQLCQTDYLWQKKFFLDFAYRPTKVMRPFGWKRLYQAMDRVEVYTWGSNEDCRLGYGRTPKKFYESVPKRVRRLDGVGIVQLAPTGWGCHALDRLGNVWAWGRIMDSNAIKADAMPRMLTSPQNVVDLAAGRQIVLARDARGQVWQWCRENAISPVTFGTDYRSHHFQIQDPPSDTEEVSGLPQEHQQGHQVQLPLHTEHDPVEQISAGWDICAALTRSGRIFAWRPRQSADERYKHRTHVQYSVSLKEQGPEGYESHVMYGDKFVKMAVGSDFIIAVTMLEKVYIFRLFDSPHYIDPTEEEGANTGYRSGRHHHHHNHNHHNQEEQQHHHHHRHHLRRRQPRGGDTEDKIVMERVADGSLHERAVELRGRILGHGLYLPIFSEALTQTVTETYEEHDQRERQQRHQLRRRQSLPLHPRSHHPHGSSHHSDHRRHHSYNPLARNSPGDSESNYGTGEDEEDDEEEEVEEGDLERPPTRSTVSPSHARPVLPPLAPSTSSRPTTVSSNFRNFALHHSSGKVLLGTEDVQVHSCPIMVDRLLANACQVEFGDHHQGLLTEDGQLRTWGAFADGALGHGDLRTGCAIPTVVEGPLKNKFVIQVAMAGWQSACLVIDLSEERAMPASDERLLDSQQRTKFAREPISNSSSGKPNWRSMDKGGIDDGYHSLELSVSGSGSGGDSGSSGSASETFDNSDGEELVYRLHRGEIAPLPAPSSASPELLLSVSPSFPPSLSGSLLHSIGQGPLEAIPFSASTLPLPQTVIAAESASGSLSTSPWLHRTTPFQPLTASCSATCSLLVSPHSHRLNSSTNGSFVGTGTLGSHSRVTPLRKRSLSMVEKFGYASSNGGSQSSSSSSAESDRVTLHHSYAHEEKVNRMLAVTRLNPTLTVYKPAESTTRQLANLI